MPLSYKKKIVTIALVAATASIIEDKQNRREWMKKYLRRRRKRGNYGQIFAELKCEDEDIFRNYMRMTPNAFDALLNKIGNKIAREDTIMRESISAGARLQATLLWLANGGSYSSLRFMTRISQPSLSYIVPETCEALYEALKGDYMKTPASMEDFKVIANGFYNRWNFPNCIGALDGMHVEIRPPQDAGSYFFNYKGTHSVIMLAVADSKYRFVYVDVGCNGRVSDTGVWDQCSLKEAIESNSIELPGTSQLPNSDISVPHVFVADNAFPLKSYLMKPYPFKSQSEDQRIFSYRLSRARQTVENAFGILANRFRVLLSPIQLEPSKVEKVVLACVVLHNYLLTEIPSEYAPTGSIDAENILTGHVQLGEWRRSHSTIQLQKPARKPNNEARAVREQFCSYFNNEGSVPWQRRLAGLEEM